MARLPYLFTTVTDHLAQTAHLSAEAMGAYEALRLHYWLRQGPLPIDQEELARLARTSPTRWKKIGPVVLQFFALTDTGYRHETLESDLKLAREKSAKARESAEQRWSSTPGRGDRKSYERNANGYANALRYQCSPSPSPSSSPPPLGVGEDGETPKPPSNVSRFSPQIAVVCAHCGERYVVKPKRPPLECTNKACLTFDHPELGQKFVNPEDYVPPKGALT